jgi:hypothetical protein
MATTYSDFLKQEEESKKKKKRIVEERERDVNLRR